MMRKRLLFPFRLFFVREGQRSSAPKCEAGHSRVRQFSGAESQKTMGLGRRHCHHSSTKPYLFPMKKLLHYRNYGGHSLCARFTLSTNMKLLLSLGSGNTSLQVVMVCYPILFSVCFTQRRSKWHEKTSDYPHNLQC